MEIKNTIDVYLTAPYVIGKHISFRSTCELTKREIKLFEFCFQMLKQYVENNHPIREDVKINIAVLDQDEITFYNPYEKSLGCHTQWVYYFIHKIRLKPAVHDAHYVATILEELIHALYLISDEIEVKKTVLEVVNMKEDIHVELDDWYQGENPPRLKPFLRKEHFFD